jgi:lipopolysaccharide/colanic/teichoic acid biosynthesis glycosyltransferase
MYRQLLKPLFDFLVAFFLLILLSPIILFLIIILSISNKGKVFFLQQRPGYKEKIFRIIKFKTMIDPPNGIFLTDQERLTIVGKFIRKLSLDELLQLINVLKGDMSIVGPRPLLVSYLDRYTDEQKKRHYVKPGITGWAQVNGRNAISWAEKFKLDVEYVDKQSFWLDFKILWLTLLNVVQRKNISAEGEATMGEFKG